ncbi:hypothetical protein [Geodermatophilus sp. URMC 63]
MVGADEEVTVLGDQEQRVWDDVVRSWAEDAEEPAPAGRAADGLPGPAPPEPAPRDLDDAPLPLVGGFWIAIALVLLGAPVAGVVLAAASALALAAWRHRPLSRPCGG